MNYRWSCVFILSITIQSELVCAVAEIEIYLGGHIYIYIYIFFFFMKCKIVMCNFFGPFSFCLRVVIIFFFKGRQCLLSSMGDQNDKIIFIKKLII